MSDNHKIWLRYILEECLFVEIALIAIKSKGEMVQNEEKKRAIVRSMEIIGEAAKKIPADAKSKWKRIDWNAIAEMRDKLLHDDIKANYEIAWETAKNKLPQLKVEIEKILKEE